MKLWLVRSGDALKAADVDSAAIFARLKFGKPLLCEVKEPRSGPAHRFYWALCQRVGNAVGISPDNVSDLLKLETGHCEIIKTRKYGEVRIPKSISYSRMEDAEFREFIDKCIVVIETEWGITRHDILDAVSDLIFPEIAHLKGAA